jgi:ribosomal protein S21
MVLVKPKPGESQDKLILRFRKRVVSSGLLLELKDRERHKPASERRKLRKYEIRHLREIEKKKQAA